MLVLQTQSCVKHQMPLFFFLFQFFTVRDYTDLYIKEAPSPPSLRLRNAQRTGFGLWSEPRQSEATCTLEQSRIKIIPARPARPHTSAAGEARAGRLVLPIAWVRR